MCRKGRGDAVTYTTKINNAFYNGNIFTTTIRVYA